MKKIKEIAERIKADIKAYGMAAVIFLVYYQISHWLFIAFCPMIIVTGLPCAGCGLTRAFLYLFTGQPERAFFINPTAFLIVAFALYCGFFRYVRGTKIKGFGAALALLMAGMLIFYFYRMYLYFPDRTPYVYTRGNLLEKRLPGYRDLINNLISLLRNIRK